ncbi:hypothetical protein [Jatrophihabitans sp.]|uniref:hypothetical protein n=1 Tax=Jatrophihabitans sp. TaxID=1932789 RepID=UPI0030C72055|nr:hypothetical protein [Jatrophihabitans sp.]
MSTLTVPPRPYAAPTAEFRVPPVHANLLPAELIAAREGSKARKVVLIAVAVAVVLMAGWTTVAKLQTNSAKSDLHRAQSMATTLTQEQGKYSTLVTAKGRAAQIQSQLSSLMANDLNWSKLYTSVRGAAPGAVVVIGLAGQVNTAAAGAGTNPSQIFNATNLPTIGSLTITGTAKNKSAVATFMDNLTKVPGIAAPYPTNVTTAGSAITFAATCLITSKALGGRYTPAGGTK